VGCFAAELKGRELTDKGPRHLKFYAVLLKKAEQNPAMNTSWMTSERRISL
jgi:hypothetical protein